MIFDKRIDGGMGFDWGRTSEDYAKYRDIYPPAFFQPLLEAGICTAGQRVLDLGTGTGVLPRALVQYGASFVGTDISPEQIEQARRLSKGLPIAYQVAPAEALPFADASFDAITACQCFFYFDHETVIPHLARLLKPGGRLAILYMAWLPAEDAIAGASEELILRYNPRWSGARETRRPIEIPAIADEYFVRERAGVFDLDVPFTRESWAGRIRACRGVGASLPPDTLAAFEADHRALLAKTAPERFTVLHYGAYAILRVRA